jgi:cell division protein FtsN
MFFKKSKNIEKKIFIDKKISDDLLPPKPKQKWKYIQRLENL